MKTGDFVENEIEWTRKLTLIIGFPAYHSQIMECLLSLKSDLIYVSCASSMCPVFLVVLVPHDANVLFDLSSCA